MTLETSKNIGGVGAILMFIGVLPLFAYTWIISLIGLIMVLVAVKGISDNYSEGRIFNNAMYAFIAVIAGVVVVVAIAFLALVSFFTALGLDLASVQDWNTLAAIDWTTVGFNVVWQFVGQVLLLIGLIWVVAIIAAFFVRRSVGLIGSKTGVGLFGTAGLLILIGAIIPLVGLLLVWISFLLLAVAFFQIRSQPTQPAAAVQAPT